MRGALLVCKGYLCMELYGSGMCSGMKWVGARFAEMHASRLHYTREAKCEVRRWYVK